MNNNENHVLTISGTNQKDTQGNVFLKDCILLEGDFNPISLHNMVTSIRSTFSVLSNRDLDIVGFGSCHAISHRDWFVCMLPDAIRIEQTGTCTCGFSNIPYADIRTMELDMYLDGTVVVGIWINLVSGLQIRLI